jgi:hypothetical protein
MGCLQKKADQIKIHDGCPLSSESCYPAMKHLHVFVGGQEALLIPRKSMWASLLAKAVAQSTLMLNVSPPS